MRIDLLDKLLCPDCRSPNTFSLQAQEAHPDVVLWGELVCSACGAHYPIVEGIPVLLPLALQSQDSALALDLSTRQKHTQARHFDSVGASELEINRPHGCGRVYSFLLQTKIDTILALYGEPISGLSILDVCCGSGMDAEFLCRAGARVLGVDISLGALRGAQERALRYNLEYDLVVGDVEALPFLDRAFDIAFVHDGLHHLDRPYIGFAEMARTAGQSVLLTEPARAATTAIAVQVGIAQAVEESGNKVHRFGKAELAGLFAQAGFDPPRIKRYAMYYQQEPLKLFYWFESDPVFALFRALFTALNWVLGRWGNKIAAAGRRRERHDT